MTGVGGRCQSWTMRPSGVAQCGRDAGRYVVCGCEHEHLIERWICEWHFALREDAGCAACYYSPTEPHECRVLITEVAPPAA